jgi:hypothetical protein
MCSSSNSISITVRVETFNRLMFEFLSKYGSPGIQERLGKLLNKD